MKGHINNETKKRSINRLHIIEGQVRGLEKMIEEEKYCVDILNQSLAIQESLKSFNALMLENHLKTHVGKQLTGKEKEKATKEMIRLYKLSTR